MYPDVLSKASHLRMVRVGAGKRLCDSGKAPLLGSLVRLREPDEVPVRVWTVSGQRRLLHTPAAASTEALHRVSHTAQTENPFTTKACLRACLRAFLLFERRPLAILLRDVWLLRTVCLLAK